MAYMEGNKGPYPNKPGEFCGNYRRLSDKYSLRQNKAMQLSYSVAPIHTKEKQLRN